MDSGKINVFLVDDDPLFLKSLENVFFDHDEFKIRTYSSSTDCLANLDKKPDVVILDFNLNSVDIHAPNGLTTLRKIKEQSPTTHVIMMSSQDKLEVAVSCMKTGASDYILKNEIAFVRMKIAIKNIFGPGTVSKTVKHWDW